MKKSVIVIPGVLCVLAFVVGAGIWHHINQVRALSVPEGGSLASETVPAEDPAATFETEPAAETLPVIDDHLAPLIYGAHDIEAFIGDSIMYLDGITITDDHDPDPVLTVDNSQVDISTEGVYPVTYIASDETGNTTSVTVELTMRIKPERYYDPEELYELCRELNEMYDIYSEDMSDVEKAFRIFEWSSTHVYYAGVSDRTDWTCAAYDGLTTLRGDCYTYYAVNRAFLDMEGIPNLLVERYPVTWSPHYWNLVYLEGAWYHCDSLAFSSPHGYYFMCAVEDLNPYDHLYDETVYGPGINIAQEAVGQYVHYDTLEVDEF